MSALVTMLKNLIVVVALAFPGYLLVKTKTLKPAHSAGFSKLLMYVGMPFLILSGTKQPYIGFGLSTTALFF